MNLIKKYRYEIIIFIMDAISMILELVASRVISPFFGNSNYVWTGVIGIILLSTSIGNYLGGRAADKEDVNENLKVALFCTSIFILVIPIFQEAIMNLLVKTNVGVAIGGILASTLLFFAPSLFMGLINPMIVRLKMKNLHTAGQSTGKIYSIATIGGLFGTFLGGFVLIPNIGSVYILYILDIIVCLMIPLVDLKIKDKMNYFVFGILLLCLTLFGFSIKKNNDAGNKVLSGDLSSTVSFDTQYGRALIYNRMLNNEKVRILNTDSGYESATFIDKDKRNDLVFEYTKYYDRMFEINECKDILMIGGAGYSYPKYFISHNPDKNMDVVEIDGDITKIARKYFYLDDLFIEYDLNNNRRLNLITEDGRVYLNQNSKKYDNILNDAFLGSNPARVLTTLECVEKIKESLKPDGAYLTNIVSSLEGDNSKFIKAEVNTISKVFKYVYVVPCNKNKKTDEIENNMVIGTDKELKIDDAYNLKIDNNTIILTDDYCPVDTLIPNLKK